ncbi:MAG: M18 family aminopeptidase [Lachnospiraceae bacterium]|nr:M18 family aminopeptidase [Lachnospiraceae bacterium]
MKNEYELFLNILEEGTSPYHVIDFTERCLEQKGFEKLSMTDEWKTEFEKNYYVEAYGTTVIAFRIPKKENMVPKKERKDPVIRLMASHTDFPNLRIKSNPDLRDKVYGKINTEVYGGAIHYTWLDRPLAVSGRISLRSKDAFAPEIKFYDSKRPLFIVPSLAIHMDRETNKGKSFNLQTQLVPIGSASDNSEGFIEFLAKELKVKKEDVLSFELGLYEAGEPKMVGMQEDMLSAARIDNISSVSASLEAILRKEKAKSLEVSAFFDHEEIGSETKQGAKSHLLADVLEKIYTSLGFTKDEYNRAVYGGMALSVDVAHAYHPNFSEKADLTNQPMMGKGFAIKEASSQSYTTDSEAIAILKSICDEKKISYQTYANRSDIPGGRTLGSFVSSQLPMKTVDMGVPILSMHSARELMGAKDYIYIREAMTAFLNA